MNICYTNLPLLYLLSYCSKNVQCSIVRVRTSIVCIPCCTIQLEEMWKNNKLAQWEDGTVSWRPPIDMWLVHVTYVLLIKNSETEQKNTTVVFAIWQIITTFWANITYSSSFSKRRNFTHQPLHKLESWQPSHNSILSRQRQPFPFLFPSLTKAH